MDRTTLLDAARLHFAHVAGSANYTRAARHRALVLCREVTAELTAVENGAAPAWATEPEPLRSVA